MNSGIIEAIFRVGILIQTLSQMAARPSGLANPYKVCGIHVCLNHTDLPGEDLVKTNQFWKKGL
jgi:hypothetical protein